MKRLIPLLAFGMLALAGCKSEPSIVGTWSTTIMGVPATIDFKADNTFSGNGSYGSNGGQGGAKVEIAGSYSKQNDKLSVTPTKIDIKDLDPALQAMFQKQIDAEKAKILNKTQEGTIKWVDKDNVAWTLSTGETTNLVRQQQQ